MADLRCIAGLARVQRLAAARRRLGDIDDLLHGRGRLLVEADLVGGDPGEQSGQVGNSVALGVRLGRNEAQGLRPPAVEPGELDVV